MASDASCRHIDSGEVRRILTSSEVSKSSAAFVLRWLSNESERFANVSDGTANMHADGTSHGSVVPATTTNNSGTIAPAESNEGRDPAERNAEQDTLHRTPYRIGKSCGLAGVREVANDFALDSRQVPYEVILHVRVCAGGPARAIPTAIPIIDSNVCPTRYGTSRTHHECPWDRRDFGFRHGFAKLEHSRHAAGVADTRTLQASPTVGTT